MLSPAALGITPAQLYTRSKSPREVFIALDKDGSGKVPLEDARVALKSLGVHLNLTEARMLAGRDLEPAAMELALLAMGVFVPACAAEPLHGGDSCDSRAIVEAGPDPAARPPPEALTRAREGRWGWLPRSAAVMAVLKGLQRPASSRSGPQGVAVALVQPVLLLPQPLPPLPSMLAGDTLRAAHEVPAPGLVLAGPRPRSARDLYGDRAADFLRGDSGMGSSTAR